MAQDHLDISITKLSRGLKSRGVNIKLEKLTRGSGFRVRSGLCSIKGEDVFFVDKNLAPDQQLSVLVDYAIDCGMTDVAREVAELPSNLKTLVGGV
jgi:hypothetical protein